MYVERYFGIVIYVIYLDFISSFGDCRVYLLLLIRAFDLITSQA